MSTDLQTKIALLEEEIRRLDPGLKIKVALLEKEVTSFSVVADKLDTAIDKLTAAAASLEKLAVLHDQRLTYAESRIAKLEEDFEIELEETNSDMKSVKSRVESIERWKWTIMGAAIAAGALATKIDVAKLFSNIF
jgi:DNA repair exonuclease SbcCD ATPase subunit